MEKHKNSLVDISNKTNHIHEGNQVLSEIEKSKVHIIVEIIVTFIGKGY